MAAADWYPDYLRAGDVVIARAHIVLVDLNTTERAVTVHLIGGHRHLFNFTDSTQLELFVQTLCKPVPK